MAVNIHVIKKDDVWQVKSEGSKRAIKNFDTQKKAIDFAVPIAKRNHVENAHQSLPFFQYL